jgi:hypothetical protein
LPTNLYVAWQNPATRTWHTVARLSRAGSGYELVFTRGVTGLLTIPSDLFRMNVAKRYSADELFPLFKNRLPSRSRTDFPKMAQWLNIKGGDDEFELLSKFGLIPGTDSLLVYPEPEVVSGTYALEFFAHGIGHMNDNAMKSNSALRAGERLLPLLDVQNPVDPDAVAIRYVDRPVLIGYVPAFYAADFRQLLSQPRLAAKAQLSFVRLNEDAPNQLRLLCRFDCPVPQGFRALNSETHQPVVDEAA